MCFNPDRVNKNIEKLKKFSTNKTQLHLGDFFQVKAGSGVKRKPETLKAKGAKAAKKSSNAFAKRR